MFKVLAEIIVRDVDRMLAISLGTYIVVVRFSYLDGGGVSGWAASLESPHGARSACCERSQSSTNICSIEAGAKMRMRIGHLHSRVTLGE